MDIRKKLDDAILAFMHETEICLTHVLNRGSYGTKMTEYLDLKDQMIEMYPDDQKLRRFLKLTSELLELERDKAQTVGMAAGLRMNAAANGELEALLFDYCEAEIDQ